MGELSYTVGGDSNLVSFKSAARVPITSLKAHFKPKRDLHGYSRAWPAGGGKNLFNKENSIIGGFVHSTTGAFYPESVANGEQCVVSDYLEAGTYTISKIPSTRFRVGVYATPNPSAYEECYEYYTADPMTSTSFTITTTHDGYFVIFCFNGENNETHTTQEIADTVQIEKGSTATSYVPYENICPIEGWTNANIYVTGEELPFVGIPGITDSLGIHFVVDDNGIITAEGTPTSWSQVMCKKYTVNGDEILYGRIIGNLKNVTNVMPQLYDANGTRLYYGEFGDGIFDTYLDLKQYPGVKTVIVGIKRLSNGIPVTGQGTFVLTKGSRKSINTIPVTFPIIGKNLFNVTDDSIIDYFENENGIYKNTSTDTRSDVQLAVQLWKTKYVYIKLGGMLYNVQTGHISFQFTNDDPNCAWIRFKYNGNNRDFGMIVPFPYGLGTYTASCDVLSADPTTVGGLQITNIQIERGTTVTAYEPCSADNTFYGGYVDVAAGEVVATHKKITLNADTPCSNFVVDGNGLWTYWVNVTGMKSGNFYTDPNVVSDSTEKVSTRWDDNRILTLVGSNNNNIYLYNMNHVYGLTTKEEVSAWLAEHPMNCTIPLANPIHIPISKSELTTFLNVNTAWSNTNDVTEASYAIHDTAPIRAAKERMAAENDKHYRKVLWNQWAPVVNADNYKAYNSTNITMTVEDDVIVQVWNKVASDYSASIHTEQWSKTHVLGRKYYLSYEYCTDFEGYIGGAVGGQPAFSNTLTEKNKWDRFSCMVQRTDGGSMYNSIVYMGRFKNTTGIEIGSKCLMRNPIAIDITQMFGNGNEPKTKAEFERLCAINNIDLYSYHQRDSGTEQMWCIPHATSDEYIKVNWNQQCKELTTSNYKPQNSNYASISAENGVMTTTILQDINEVYQSSFISNYSIAWDVSHKYYYKQEINSSTNSTYVLIYRSKWGRNQTLLPNTWTTLEGITSPESTDSTGIFLAYNTDKAIGGVTGASCQVRNPILIDLTKMFGAGNEPATVAELREACLKNNINLDEAQPYTTGSTIMWKK